jgi:hypothetical protein
MLKILVEIRLLVVSLVLGSLLSLCQCSLSTNNKIALISKRGNGVLITLKGKGAKHPSGLKEAIFPKLFDDSIQLLTEYSADTIDFRDVVELYPIRVTSVDTSNWGKSNTGKIVFDSVYFSKGNISIKNDFLHVDLYTTYPDYPKNDPSSWNGDYTLKWAK